MRRISTGLFLIALTTLMMELALTRVFDVILVPNMAYMVITCAMFSFGLAGIYATLRPLMKDADVEHYLSIVTVLFGIFSIALLPLLNILPFDYKQLDKTPITQIFAFLGMYLVLAIPFFLSGLVFSTVFSTYSNRIQRLYFWDLAGAAMGSIILVPFLPSIGPGGLMFCACSFAMLASGLFSNNRKWKMVVIPLGIIVFIIPFVRSEGYFEFREHLSKRGVREAKSLGKVEVTFWDPISKIDVFDIEHLGGYGKRKHIAYDGGSQSSHIFPFDGDYQALRDILPGEMKQNFWQVGVISSHFFKRDSNQKVLIIGSAGGQETKAALTYGASHVDAVELVGFVVELGKSHYADYNGNIFNDPRVNAIKGEGRSFLRASKDKYDIIQIFSNHTSSSIAAGTGAMATTYLQTVEAYKEYFSHLNENGGILHINHHIYPRMIATAAVAWKEMGLDNLQDHVVVFQKVDSRDYLPTTLIKMTPWTESEINLLIDFYAMPSDEDWKYEIIENPLDPEGNFLSPVFYSADFPDGFFKEIPYRAMPTTDNRPFFNYLRKKIGKVSPDPEKFMNLSTTELLNSQIKRSVPMDSVHLVVTAGASLFFACVFIILPLYFSKIGKSGWQRKNSGLTYFSCLGAGFIIFELIFIQIFMKLIGYPLYTYSTVVFTILLAAGIGSVVSGKLEISPDNRWTWPFVGILISSLALTITFPFIFNVFLAAPTAIRILVAGTMIFPLGFFLGMPFPLGILAIQHQPKGAIAWAWGVNGLFTVIGGLLSVLLSIFVGFRETLLLSVGLYCLAFFMFSRIRLGLSSAKV
jgi:hypothetical protein